MCAIPYAAHGGGWRDSEEVVIGREWHETVRQVTCLPREPLDPVRVLSMSSLVAVCAGVCTWPNGERYEGEYKDDKMNGQGEGCRG